MLALLPEFCKSFQITFSCLLVTQVWAWYKNPPLMLGPLAGEVLKPFSYKSSFPPGRDRETLPDISLLHAQPYRWALHRMPLIHNHKVILIFPSEHSIIIWLLGWYLPPYQHPFDINCCQMLFYHTNGNINAQIVRKRNWEKSLTMKERFEDSKILILTPW